LTRSKPLFVMKISPRTSKRDGSGADFVEGFRLLAGTEVGMDLMVLTLVVMFSPRTPSPRVAAVRMAPLS
jgi:hypothetical protein